MSAHPEPLLNSKQIAERLNVSVRQATNLMREMHPINVGCGAQHRLLRVRAAEFDAWLQRRVQQPEPVEVGRIDHPKRMSRTACAAEFTPEGKIPYRKPGGATNGK